MTTAQRHDRWRPNILARPAVRPTVIGQDQSQEQASPLAFGLIMAFTFILLLAPQAHFPALAPLRPAFWVANASLLVYLLDRFINRKPITIMSREISLVAALLGWAVLTIPMSLWPGGSVGELEDKYLKSLIIFWLLSNVVNSVSRCRQVFWALSLMSIPLSVVGVKNYLTGVFVQYGREIPLDRIRGYDAPLTSNPNDLALMLNLILPLSAALLFMEARPFRRLILLAAMALNVVAVVTTFSRAGAVTLGSIGLIYVWKLRNRPERRWVYAALVLALLCMPLLPGGYLERITTMTDISSDSTHSSEARWRDLGAATRFALKHPIIGAGLGSDQLALNSERGGLWSSVHNVYLQYAVDLGIPGVTLFLLILIGCLRRLAALRRRYAPTQGRPHLVYLADGLYVSLCVFAVAAFFYPVAYHFYFYYIAGLAVALTARHGTVAARKATN